MDSPKPKRRWTRYLIPRYSLRALLILVTVISVVLGYHVNGVRKQKEAVAWVKKKGSAVSYEYSTASAGVKYGWEPEYLRNLLGDDFFYDVVVVNLADQEVSDLSPLASLTNLEYLHLNETAVSDLSPLASLTNLKGLDLSDTPVSDLSPLASLTNLEVLNLDGTSVSDLSPLVSLTNLEYLSLSDTSVSDLSPLASLTNLERLDLIDTQVSDLSPLASLTNLVSLELEGSKVSKEEIAKLEAALPNCNIEHDFGWPR